MEYYIHFDRDHLLSSVSSADNFCKQFGPRSGPTKGCDRILHTDGIQFDRD